VNQHPHHSIDFEAWCKKIESKLVTGEQFFKNKVGLFDAMPSFWKQMTCQGRHEVVGMIDGFSSSVNQNGETNSSPWTIENDCKLVKYIALDDINQCGVVISLPKSTHLCLLSHVKLQRWQLRLQMRQN